MGHRRFFIYFGKKLGIFFISVVLLSVTVFYVARIAPGDPLVAYYGERAEKMSQQTRAQAMKKLGLDAPIHVQYFKWVANALRGEFGISYQYKQPVTEVIGQRIANTILLGGGGFLCIFVASLLLGIFCALQKDAPIDRILCKIGVVASCIPEFWLSLVLILIFSVNLKLLPSGGAYSVGKEGDVADRLLHLCMPLAVVVLSHLWYYAYLVRNKMAEEMKKDYVLVERAKGFGKTAILFRHCLPNALPTYLATMAVAFPHVLGGTYVVESVFSYPGIGALSYDSARYRDYNLLMVLCMLTGILVLFCNLLSQILGERIDPRMRA